MRGDRLTYIARIRAIRSRLLPLGWTNEDPSYRKNEPDPIPRETSQVLDKVFNTLKQEGTTKVEVSRALHLHVTDLEALVFGLVVVPAGGGRGAARLALVDVVRTCGWHVRYDLAEASRSHRLYCGRIRLRSCDDIFKPIMCYTWRNHHAFDA